VPVGEWKIFFFEWEVMSFKSTSAEGLFVLLEMCMKLVASFNLSSSLLDNPFVETPLLSRLLINTTSLLCDCNIR
jgi:hypothetical protein